MRVLTTDPKCETCGGTGMDDSISRRFCPQCVKPVDIEAREVGPNKTLWEHVQEPHDPDPMNQALEIDEATYIVVAEHGVEYPLYDIQCVSSSDPHEEGFQYRIPAKMWRLAMQRQQDHDRFQDMFRRISLLADERVIRGDGSAFVYETPEQRQILDICREAGITISACIGATGPTGPPTGPVGSPYCSTGPAGEPGDPNV